MRVRYHGNFSICLKDLFVLFRVEYNNIVPLSSTASLGETWNVDNTKNLTDRVGYVGFICGPFAYTRTCDFSRSYRKSNGIKLHNLS